MSRILVIDDEELVRYSLKRVLEGAGFDVTEAGDGDQGLKAVEAQSFDLVITDIIMPNKEGIETVIDLKRLRPDLKVVAMSGGGRTRNLDYLNVAREFGADEVLAKPFSEDELLAVVRGCLTRTAMVSTG